MTIYECKKRERILKALMSKIDCVNFALFSEEEIEVLKTAVARSIAIENLNIAELKKKKKGELENV